ncbi:MAG: hypothetical protein A2026_00960 [Deltaproteobacteria bacterium RBG_19FT_COMBO_46_12]|nr:MAG: hypothetical protein A2026_00960 [Deltaproteobacteria bacterium RBG_19FT_COMBO_46_12]
MIKQIFGFFRDLMLSDMTFLPPDNNLRLTEAGKIFLAFEYILKVRGLQIKLEIVHLARKLQEF